MTRDRVLTAAAALGGALLLGGAERARASEWRVPGDFRTIQAAMDSDLVEDGDTIRVKHGRRRGAIVTKAVIHGRVRVPRDDCGGYDAPAIVLFADFRSGAPAAATIERNRVTKNQVFLRSTRPALVPVSGVELTDTRDDGSLDPVVKDNAVVYNVLRGLEEPVSLTPEELAAVNRIEHNLTGPCAFSPDRTASSVRATQAEPAPAR